MVGGLINRPVGPLSRTRRWLSAGLVLCATGVLYLVGSLAFIDRPFEDLRFRLSQHAPSGDLVVVAIDRKSLDSLDVWPWPRRYHAQLVEALLGAGARDIGFDVDFSASSGATDDAAFERALAANPGRVILPVFKHVVDSADGPAMTFVRPLQRFRQHTRLASINVQPAGDGLVRTMRVWESSPLGAMPSMAAELANVDQRPSFYLDYGIDVDAIPIVSFIDVLHGNFAPDAFEDKVVLVGATAIELQDVIAVPVHRALSGVFVHALGFESLVTGRALRPIHAISIFALLALLTVLLPYRMDRWPWKRALVIAVAVPLVVGLGSVIMQSAGAVIVDQSPTLVLTIALFVISLTRRIDDQTLTLLAQGVRLQQADMLMRNVVESSFDGILTCRQDGTVQTANAAAARLFACHTKGIEAQRIQRLLPELASTFDQGSGTAPELGSRETIACRHDGTTFPAEVSISHVTLEDEQLVTAIVRDITERKRHEERLSHQATHDDLTGLPNRRLLLTRINEAIVAAEARSESMALLLIDLNRFKDINDTLGHHIGDSLLRQVAERLQSVLKAGHIIGRLGGDEFAVALPPPCDSARAWQIAQDLVDSLVPTFNVASLDLDISGSVGVAVYPEHATSATRLLQCADVAMYIAKGQQLTIAGYDADLDHNSMRFLTLTGELRRAIESGLLDIAYQPKIDVQSRRIKGVEALSRWTHDTHGPVAPEQFIIHAEQTGLIEPLTRWTLETVLSDLAKWHGQGLALEAAINLSPRTLLDPQIVVRLQHLLQHHKVDPRFLTLEVTESAVMHDPDAALAVLNDLRNLGVGLSIDDYGTGYSSLSYLKRLPVDELKIDKSFVAHLLDDTGDAVIVRSTINMAHDLGLRVVIEGIETEQHFERIATFGADQCQGYLFSPPVSFDALSAMLGAMAAEAEDPRPRSAAAVA